MRPRRHADGASFRAFRRAGRAPQQNLKHEKCANDVGECAPRTRMLDADLRKSLCATERMNRCEVVVMTQSSVAPTRRRAMLMHETRDKYVPWCL